ncbi:MAG: hypothetical protein IIC64_15080 [SAR324 cluster bacterium]|nr:hypothetical protein [SAR324 cluster bacterium]
MITEETSCPCCEKKIRLDIHGWFLLRESMAELIACVNGDPGVERPQDLPLMGMCTTICPECGKQCMIDFQFDVARYLELLKDSFPENYQSKDEVEDNDFFENLEGALSNLAIKDSVDITCLA